MIRSIQSTTGVLWENATTTDPTYIATFTQLDPELPDEGVANIPLKTPAWALVLIGLAGSVCFVAVCGLIWVATRRAKARRVREYDAPLCSTQGP